MSDCMTTSNLLCKISNRVLQQSFFAPHILWCEPLVQRHIRWENSLSFASQETYLSVRRVSLVSPQLFTEMTSHIISLTVLNQRLPTPTSKQHSLERSLILLFLSILVSNGISWILLRRSQSGPGLLKCCLIRQKPTLRICEPQPLLRPSWSDASEYTFFDHLVVVLSSMLDSGTVFQPLLRNKYRTSGHDTYRAINLIYGSTTI